MKKYFVLALFSVLLYGQSYSQCTPVDCPGAPSLFPFGGICDTILPAGMINVSYSESESFRATDNCINPSSFDPTLPDLNLKIRSLRDFTFSNFPLGLTATTNQSTYSTSGGLVVGCAAITGTPLEAGLFQPQIGLTADATIYLLDLFGPCTGIEVDSSAGFDFSLDLIILPDPSFAGLNSTYCESDPSATLTSTGSHTGTFSGPGVTGSQFDPASAGPGTHMIIHTVSAQDGTAVGPAVNADTQTVVVEPLSICSPCAATQDIPIESGWNIISSYIQPEDPDMLVVMQDITNNILIVKNGAGNATFPGIPLNGIGNWNVAEGYKVKALNDTILTMGCSQADPSSSPISVPVNWSIISYLRDSPMNAATALASLGNDLLLVKDNDGNVFFPSIPLNSIGDMMPGQGYQVKMSVSGTLTYPPNAPRVIPAGYDKPGEAIHFAANMNTGSNASIIVPDGVIHGLQPGDEIGVYGSNGSLSGVGVFVGGPFAITVWGQDHSDQEARGMAVGETYHFRVWKKSNNREFAMFVEYDSGEPFYSSDGISVLKTGSIAGYGSTFDHLATELTVYPNPVLDRIQMEVVLPDASSVVIRIFDVTGKDRVRVSHSDLDKGAAILEIDVSGLPPGQYFYRLETKDRSFNGGFVKMD